MASDDPGVSFNMLVMSLATSAAIHFGDAVDPASGQRPEPNLPAASHMIEMLALLQEKTRGNLADDEHRLLEQVLYELRLRFLDAQKGEKRIVEP